MPHSREQRQALRGSKLLSVQGNWQSDKGVQSLVALKLRDHSELLQGLRVASVTSDEHRVGS